MPRPPSLQAPQHPGWPLRSHLVVAQASSISPIVGASIWVQSGRHSSAGPSSVNSRSTVGESRRLLHTAAAMRPCQTVGGCEGGSAVMLCFVSYSNTHNAEPAGRLQQPRTASGDTDCVLCDPTLTISGMPQRLSTSSMCRTTSRMARSNSDGVASRGLQHQRHARWLRHADGRHTVRA